MARPVEFGFGLSVLSQHCLDWFREWMRLKTEDVAVISFVRALDFVHILGGYRQGVRGSYNS